MPSMPVLDAFIRITLEELMIFAGRYLYPGCLEIEHYVHLLRWRRQRRMHGRCIGIYPLRPARIRGPERAAAFTAEIPLAGALYQFIRIGIVIFTVNRTQARLACNNHRIRFRHDIDTIPAAARRCPAELAVAPHVRVRCMRQSRKRHGTTITATFKFKHLCILPCH